MAWQITWNGTTWNLAAHECPDQAVPGAWELGGDGLRTTYAGLPTHQARWRKRSIELSWTGVDAALYGTLSALAAYTGTVTFTTSDGIMGTQTGLIDPASVRDKSYGYSCYDMTFRFRGN